MESVKNPLRLKPNLHQLPGEWLRKLSQECCNIERQIRNQFKAINDEEMPMHQWPFMKGKLYIHFTIDFLDSLIPDQCKALESILPPGALSQLIDMELDESEETTLHDVNVEEEMPRKQQAQAQEAYKEDEDMHGGAQRVQCAQQ